MFENFLKKHESQTENVQPVAHSQAKSRAVIQELKLLENDILEYRPANIKFIHDWAGKRCTQQKKTMLYQDEDEEEFMLSNSFKAQRRNAVYFRSTNEDFLKKKQNQVPKNEETKSMIMIILGNMPILSSLPPQDLWALVEESEIRQFEKETQIIAKGDPITMFYIVLEGLIGLKSAFKKEIVFSEGNSFGEDSILFQQPSNRQYFAKENSKLAIIHGSKISGRVRKANEAKYNFICRSLLSLEIFNLLYEDELDRVVSIALNQKLKTSVEGEQVFADFEFLNSFFIVFEGEYEKHLSKFDNKFNRQGLKKFKPGDIFGANCLTGQERNEHYICSKYGKVVEIKVGDVERSIGLLSRILKRRSRK